MCSWLMTVTVEDSQFSLPTHYTPAPHVTLSSVNVLSIMLLYSLIAKSAESVRGKCKSQFIQFRPRFNFSQDWIA